MEEDGGVIRFSLCDSLSSLFCLTLVNIFNSLFFFTEFTMPKSVLVLFAVQITNITLSFPGQEIIFPNFNPDARIYNIKIYIFTEHHVKREFATVRQ